MLSAWIGSAGGVFVFDGDFSAGRRPDGNWITPAPSGLNVRDLVRNGFSGRGGGFGQIGSDVG